ncbi:hypothetical protein [Paenibacillus lignilyticus]|uniref:Uncharacterized protein n=1 Tax=Paenibacillus lignilyticus TaxID=1172615 RepID=A0ABS5C938_9BACL|nr:hypothetical protein [Paenibacillus lignilyticus]MBP3962519.1 hypothetical protein [Paenibacillus lignilyticus]
MSSSLQKMYMIPYDNRIHWMRLFGRFATPFHPAESVSVDRASDSPALTPRE